MLRFFSTVVLLVTLIFPHPSFGQTAGSFFDARVLAIRSAPFLALVAVKESKTKYAFETRNQKGKVLERVEEKYKSAGRAPAFNRKALLARDPARKAISKHKMRIVRPGSVAVENKGAGAILYLKNRTEVVIVTSVGRLKVASFENSPDLEVQFYFDNTAGVAVVAGSNNGPKGQPVAGVLTFVALGKQLKELSDDVLAALWLESAENQLTRRSLDAGCEILGQALKLKKSARGRYLGFFCHARSGRFKDALQQLKALEIWAGRSTAGKRLLARVAGSPLAREAALQSLDINRSRKISFKAAKGFEGTSVWVKIKDGNGNNVAVFKPTNGNTYHRGEVFTYQMAKLMGTEQLYPVTFLHTLDKSGCKKFTDALGKVKYKGMKEKNRKALIGKCKKRGKLEGAVKEWVRDFQFFQAIGKAPKLKKHSLYKHLQARGAHPAAGKEMKVKTVTRLYKPDHCKKATYKGVMNVKQLAGDMSDLMIMDVLNANEDRFPGANIEFKSINGGKEVKKCIFDLGKSRVFSLDNGATFKGTRSNALADFTKRLKVSRFRRSTYETLDNLHSFVSGKTMAPGFVRKWGVDSVDDLTAYLALDKGDSHKRRKVPFSLFEKNLSNVRNHMKAYRKNKNAWFK